MNDIINNNRQKWVDIAKGICILLIIRGHIYYNFFPNWVNEDEYFTIYHVSAFYVIAGFFMKEERLLNTFTFVKKS